MITETLLNSLKSLFSSLGAKTTDNNYAVPLLNKTNGTPQGMMDMSSLASVLGVLDLSFDTSTWTNKSVTVPAGGQKLFDLTDNQVKIFAFMYQGRKGVYSCNREEGSVTAIVPAVYVRTNDESGNYVLKVHDSACYFEATGQVIDWKVIWEKN